MKPRPHKQIAVLYFSDRDSVLEWYHYALSRWIKYKPEFHNHIFSKGYSYRLTSQGRTYISEPDKPMYEVIKIDKGIVYCPLLKKRISIHLNDLTVCGCIKCKMALSVNDERVHCKNKE